MIYQIEQLKPQGILLIKTSGQMTGAGFISMAEDILHHPQWAKGISVVFDHQELDFSAMPVGDLEKIRSFHQSHDDTIGSGKSAIVVGSGRAGQWEELWSQGRKIHLSNQVKVFEGYQEALDWAGC